MLPDAGAALLPDAGAALLPDAGAVDPSPWHSRSEPSRVAPPGHPRGDAGQPSDSAAGALKSGCGVTGAAPAGATTPALVLMAGLVWLGRRRARAAAKRRRLARRMQRLEAMSLKSSCQAFRRAPLLITLLATACANPASQPDPAGDPAFIAAPAPEAAASPAPRFATLARPILQDLDGVWSVCASDVWAVGAAGTIVHYDGAWSTDTSPTTQHLRSVWADTEGRAFAVGAAGTILQRSGGDWALAGSLRPGDLWGVWASASNDAWAVGDDGLILHWNGTEWSISLDRKTGDLRAVWGSGPADVWVVGGGTEPDGDDASLILHWDGLGWSESYVCNVEGSRFGAAGWVAVLHDVWGVRGGPVWAAGSCMPGASFIPQGNVVRHDAAGWSDSVGLRDTLGEFRPLGPIWGSGPNDIWAASAKPGDDAHVPTMLHFDGQIWTASPQAMTAGIRDLGGSAADDVWAVGEGGKRLHYDGTAWSAAP